MQYSIPLKNEGDNTIVLVGRVVIQGRSGRELGQTDIPPTSVGPNGITYVSGSVCITAPDPQGPYSLVVTVQDVGRVCDAKSKSQSVQTCGGLLPGATPASPGTTGGTAAPHTSETAVPRRVPGGPRPSVDGSPAPTPVAPPSAVRRESPANGEESPAADAPDKPASPGAGPWASAVPLPAVPGAATGDVQTPPGSQAPLVMGDLARSLAGLLDEIRALAAARQATVEEAPAGRDEFVWPCRRSAPGVPCARKL